MTQKDSQAKMLELRVLESRMESFMKHREMIGARIAEIDQTMAGVESVGKSKEDVLFHVGGEAFVPARPVADGKVVVMIGADVALEKTFEEAKATLESRKKEAEAALKEMDREIGELNNKMNEMMSDIESGHPHSEE